MKLSNRGLSLYSALCATTILALALPALGGELWRIGEFDDSYDEFACARDHSQYPPSFPEDVNYRIGESEPGDDWSFIHPGPIDAWAGRREHPFAIRFDLERVPEAALELTIDLVDAHGLAATSVVIAVNDAQGTYRLERGAGDDTLRDPANGRQQVINARLSPSLFTAGTNRITLTSTGSWVLYDAISLSTAHEAQLRPRVTAVNLTPTPFLKRDADGQLRRAVNAEAWVDGAPQRITFAARGDDWSAESTAEAALHFGTVESEILVPPVHEPTNITVKATAGDSQQQAEAVLKPARRWRIFMTPSVHTDIGYTDIQPNVVERHFENTDRAIDLCRQFPAFGWNLEVAWQADIYRRHRSDEECEALYELARNGQIGIQADYLNMLTGLCSHEELNRWLYYAHQLHREHGVPFDSALITDVPTQMWSVPSTLAAAGIRYYATGINNTRASTFRDLQTGQPYWWVGPDDSRVLAYFSPGYARCGHLLKSFDNLKNWMVQAAADHGDFPYDALFLYGGFGDNQALAEDIAATAQKWQQEYEYPKLTVGPVSRYFEYMESEYGDDIEEVRGCAGAYWEDGAASSAAETAMNRRAHETASAADALFAFSRIAGRTNTPDGRLQDLWRNVLLFDEHTWGAWCSISRPDDPQTKQQWEIKAGFAEKADQQSGELLDDGLARLASLIEANGPAVIVFNPTSWPRQPAIAHATLPPGRVPCDPQTGEALPTVAIERREDSNQVLFRAPPVPAFGYVVCPLHDGEPADVQVEAIESGDPAILRNSRYRVEIDPNTGGVARLIDRASGRDLVDETADWTLNEYLYVEGGEGSSIINAGNRKAPDLTVHEPEVKRLSRRIYPGIGQEIACEAQCMNTPQLQGTVRLWDDCPWVEFDNSVTRNAERDKEAVYFAFPFALQQPDVRLEIPNGVMRPEVDQLPGACKDWYAVQHWAHLADADTHLTWTSPDAPLICLQDINRGQWRRELTLENGHLYSYAMNNYWFTNYCADQSGTMSFNYALTSRLAGNDAQAARFGWQRSAPLHCTTIDGSQSGPLTQVSASLCEIEPNSVFATAIKVPEAAAGIVVRLISYASEPLQARVRVPMADGNAAFLCNLVEEPLDALPIEDGWIRVPVDPMSPTTILIQ